MKQYGERPISRRRASALLRSGRFRPATGMYPGRHFRSRDGDGCLHLRVLDNGRAYLHRDRWDPGVHPIRHVLEALDHLVRRAVR